MELTELLGELLRDYSDVSVSRLTGIERTRLNRIRNGKFQIEFDELQAIIKALMIDDDTARRLYDAFLFRRLGRDRYNAHRLTKDFLTSMKFDEVDSGLFGSDSLRAKLSVDLDFPGEVKVITGLLSVKYIITMIMTAAASKKETVRIVSSPFHTQLLATILTLTASNNDLEIKHVFSLSTADELADPQTYYMQAAKAIYPIFMLNSNYSAYYSISGHITNSIMPYCVITRQFCLMISADAGSAVLVKNRDAVELFTKTFDNRLSKCLPFIKKIRTGGEYLAHYGRVMEAMSMNAACKRLYSIDFEPCMLHLLTEKDLLPMTIAAQNDPLANDSLQMILSELLEPFNQLPQKAFFTKRGVDSFIKTGQIAEIPEVLGLRFDYGRRREMLCAVLEEAKKNDPNSRQYYLLNENEFEPPLGLRFLGSGLGTDHLFVMSDSIGGVRSILMFSNPEVKSAVFEFIETLAESNMVYPHDEMITYLEKTIGEM